MPENKTYKYKAQDFKLKPHSLEMMHNAAPLMIKYRRLLWEHTKDIDMRKVENAKLYISELETALEQMKKENTPDIVKIDELTLKLGRTKEDFETNNEYQSLIKLYSDSEKLAMYELITDSQLIKPFLCSVLDGNTDKLDFTGADIFELVKEVVPDFFSLIAGNSPG
jgi:hypothetical protein